MSAIAAAAIGAAGAVGGNLLGSASQSAMGYYMSKKMAKYNYTLQKRGYKEFPSAQVEGLRAAGINPMVAYGSIGGATAHSGNYQTAPGSDLGSSALSDYRENKKVNPQLENINADTQMKKDQGEAATAQAGAAMMNAKANLISSQANAARANAETKQIETRTPGENAWGTADRIIGNAGSAGAALGGSALAAKGVYDIVKKPAVAAGAAGAGAGAASKAGAKAAVAGAAAKAAARPGPWASKASGAMKFGGKALGAIGTALMAHDYLKYFGEESKRQIEAEKKNPEVRKQNEKRNKVYSPYGRMGRRRRK